MICFIEKIPVFAKLCSGMGYSAKIQSGMGCSAIDHELTKQKHKARLYTVIMTTTVPLLSVIQYLLIQHLWQLDGM